jgi:hypothetical protein
MKTIIGLAISSMLATSTVVAQNKAPVLKILTSRGAPLNFEVKSPSKSVNVLNDPVIKLDAFKGHSNLIKGLSSQSKLGGTDPGGGLFIEENGVTKSLGEAGFIFSRASEMIGPAKEYPTYYQVDSQTKEELRKILEALPFASSWNENQEVIIDLNFRAILATSNRSTLIQQDEFNEADYAKIVDAYAKVIEKYGYKLDVSMAYLPAFTRRDASGSVNTYFLPKFDGRIGKNGENNEKKSLSPYQRALNLIHEYHMRSLYKDFDEKVQRNFSEEVWKGKNYAAELDSKKIMPVIEAKLQNEILTQVLEIDSVIHEYLQGPRGELEKFEFARKMQKLPADLFQNKRLVQEVLSDRFFQMFLAVQTGEGRPLLASEIYLTPSVNGLRSASKIDPSLAKKFDRHFPRFAQTLEKQQIFPKLNHYSQNHMSYRELSRYIVYDKLFIEKLPGLSHRMKSEDERVQTAKYLINLFTSVCNQNNNLLKNSDFFENGEFLIYSDIQTRQVYSIECRSGLSSPVDQMKGYGGPIDAMNFDN